MQWDVNLGDVDPLGADRERPFLVAAPGRSHGGDAGRARRIIEAAAAADVDAVQLPLYRTDHLVSSVHDAEQAREYRRTELDRDTWASLADEARRAGTRLAPTVYDPTLLEWVLQRDPPYVRFHGGDLTYRRLLSGAATASVPVFLGTKAATPDEVDRALDWLGEAAERTVRLGGLAGKPDSSDPPSGLIVPPDPRERPRPNRPLPRVLELQLRPEDGSAGTVTRTLRDLQRRLRDRFNSTSPAGSEPEPPPRPPEDPGPVRRSLMADRPLSAGTILEPDMIRELRPAGGVPAGRIRECLGLRVARPADPMEMIAVG